MKGRGERLLYLDFDGVLHHENVLWHPRIGAYMSAPDGYVLFQHAELLERMLAPYPEVQIVLSTSWVRRYGCARSAKQLRPSLRRRVIGATFHSKMNQHEFALKPRGMQVWEDVLTRRPRDWLALDDDWFDWPKCCSDKYVKTNLSEGLSDTAVQEIFATKLQEMCQ
jgi:HAD domain in Swiss Army Knife RNA repair proteins